MEGREGAVKRLYMIEVIGSEELETADLTKEE